MHWQLDSVAMLMKTPKQILSVPRVSLRLECIIFQREFEDQLATILPDLKALHIACEDLRNNHRLGHLLQIVLFTGNALNKGTFRGNAKGFHITDLSKVQSMARNRTVQKILTCIYMFLSASGSTHTG
jgi:hypothetical protein